MNGTLFSAAWLMLQLQGAPSPIVRFDSREQGRTFYVDTDRRDSRSGSRVLPAASSCSLFAEGCPLGLRAASW